MNKADIIIRDIRADLIKTYLISDMFDTDYVSTSMIEQVCNECFPHWNVTEEDIIYFGDKLYNVR